MTAAMHSATHDRQVGPTGSKRLSRAEFALRYDESARLLWCIAAAILADRHGADDVVQEAVVIALGKLDEFDPATSFKAWMSQIVRFTALNHARLRRRREAALEEEAPRLASSRGSKHTAAPIDSTGQIAGHQSDFDDEVVHALGSLDETARACLLLRVVLELPYREISLALNIPEGSAMSHVHRARCALRERLSKTQGARGADAVQGATNKRE